MLLAFLLLLNFTQAEEPEFYCFHTEKLWEKETVGDQEMVIMDVNCTVSYPTNSINKVYKVMCPYNKTLEAKCGWLDFTCDSKAVDKKKNEAVSKCAQSFEKLKADLKCEEACVSKKHCKADMDKACTFRKLKALKANKENPMHLDTRFKNRRKRLDNAIEGRSSGGK